MIAIGTGFLLVVGCGEPGHPPAGNELPTGRVGYVVVLRGGELLGGGLLSADRSAELISASRTVVGPLAGLTEH